MIEVEHLSKSFGRFKAVNDISFNVAKGEVVGFLGPNGAGKTTTMRILAGFYPPTSGSAKVGGFDVLEQSLEVRQRVGYFPERAPIYPDISVTTFLDFVAEVKGISRRERKQKVDNVMELCGVTQMSHKLVGHLSKGYRQRVCLAQALLNDPEVLILDEPTIGLDPEQITEIRSLIKNLRGKRTILLSTHILPEVSMTCERVIIINDGKLVVEDSPENLHRRLRTSHRILITVDGPPSEVKRKIESLPGIITVSVQAEESPGMGGFLVEAEKGSDIRKLLATTITGNNWGLLEMKTIEMSLEEIFLKLVTEEKDAKLS
ncbi:MAG: ATP-binding cassette domain-containing protein [Pseudomonadota bacterium]